MAGLASLAGIAAWAAIQNGFGSRDARGSRAASPAEALGAESALTRAVELDREGRHRESLTYFRRAAEAGSGWLVHWDYAAALNNAAIELSDRGGVVAPASRSSVERVWLARAALEQVAMAESLAPSTHHRVQMEIVRGQTLQLWGFPLEALAAYRAALALEPGSAAAHQREATLLTALRAGN